MNDITLFFNGWPPIVRILVVGTLSYIAIIILLRASMKRTLAQMNAFDFVITVALGASFGRVLTARDVALVEAITAFTLLVTLQLIMSWLSVRSHRFAKMVTSRPSLLFYHGQVLHDALQRERVTEAELEAAVRMSGAGSLGEAEAVVLEANGKFAVVKKSAAGDGSALQSLL